MHFQVLAETVDLPRQEGHLHLRGAGVSLVDAVGIDEGLLLIGGQHAALGAPFLQSRRFYQGRPPSATTAFSPPSRGWLASGGLMLCHRTVNGAAWPGAYAPP